MISIKNFFKRKDTQKADTGAKIIAPVTPQADTARETPSLVLIQPFVITDEFSEYF